MKLPAHSVLGFLSSLVEAGLIAAESQRRVHSAFMATGQPIDVIIRELGLVPEAQLAAELARYSGFGCQSEVLEFDQQLLDRIGQGFAEESAILPARTSDRKINLVVADPFATSTFKAIAYLVDESMVISVAQRTVIDNFFKEFSKKRKEDQPEFLVDEHADEDDVDRLLDIAREAPVVKFVARILQKAVEEKATDIHIEPLEDSIQIRFRKDGLLEMSESASKGISAGVTSRIKILAKLNISERRLPQDGRLRMSIRGSDVDFRVSTVPSIYGETIVLRILDRSNVKLDLATLGYEEGSIERIRSVAERPNGIILMTGPTGSGKTTTLFSILNNMSREDRKIFTVEDPVEYRINGVTQLQVDPSIGLTFATALRSVLRQDPDVILVGEIRDAETARIAVQAALTGHLVLSTLHTNSAVGAVNRLRDMGIESYLLAATIRGVISQRLVRQVCSACFARTAEKSCDECGDSRYFGRRAVYELLEINESIRAAIARGEGNDEIDALAKQGGMRSLAEHASELVQRGLTSIDEVSRVVDLEGD